MNRETSSLISIETIKAIIKKELGVNLYNTHNPVAEHYQSKNLNHSVSRFNDDRWFVKFGKETKSCVDLEMVNHYVKTEKDLLYLIRKFKKVRKMI